MSGKAATTTAPAAATDPTKGKPGRKPGQKADPKPFLPLDFAQITVTKVQDPDTMREHRRARGERDQDQVAIDSLVRESHNRWVEAGRPEEWGKCISASYTLRVPGNVEDTVVRRIRRSASYFDVSVRFGASKALDGGNVQILFFAKDKPVKGGDENVSTDADGVESAEGTNSESE